MTDQDPKQSILALVRELGPVGWYPLEMRLRVPRSEFKDGYTLMTYIEDLIAEGSVVRTTVDGKERFTAVEPSYPFVALCVSDRAYMAEGPDGTVVAPGPGDDLSLLTTVGKRYRILGEKLGMYIVVNNMGSTSLHPKPYFQRVEEASA